MKRKISFGITLLLMLSLLLLALTACGEKECEHSYQGAVTKAATCESDGVMTYTCSLCTDSYTEVINALGHDEIPHGAKAPTCAEIGWDAYVTCSRCNYNTCVELPISGDLHTTANGACTGCGIPESTAGLEYIFNPDDKTYTVTGIGSCTSKDVVIGVYNNRSVTVIGSNAFSSGCESLTSVTIGDSVTGIGSYAFKNCSGLKSVTIGNGVTSIGHYALFNCSSLASVTIGNGVTSIGDDVFYGCDLLMSVYITDIAAWCKISFASTPFTYAENLYLNGELVTDLVIPDSVTSIGDGAFSGCSNLASVVIPDSVTSIGNSAFSGCRNLASVVIPDSVISIGNSAFSGCTSLTSVTIPDSVTSIGYDPFEGCTSLEYNEYNNAYYLGNETNPYVVLIKAKNINIGSVNIYEKTRVISDGAFSGCWGLMSVTIGNGVTSIGDWAFNNCTSLTSVTIPDSVTSIGEDAFYGCTSLTSVTIPDSVTSIGDRAFSNCRDLTSVTIGNGVTSIGDYAFSSCTSLTSVTIPDSVTSIGDYAFKWCSGLTSVTIPDSVTSIGDSAFYRCDSLTIYCEAASKPSGWDSDWNPSNRPVVWGYEE